MPKGKDHKFRIEFTVHFQKVRDLPKSLHGSEIWLECKRGKKSQHERRSETQTFDDGTELTFDEKHKWELSLSQNDKKQWDKKELTIYLKEGKGKGKELGKTTLPLHEYADNGTIRTAVLPIAMSKKDKSATRQPSLAAKVTAYWTQMGDKQLMKKEEAKKVYSHEKETEFVGSLAPKKDKKKEEEEEKPAPKGKSQPAKPSKVSDSEEEKEEEEEEKPTSRNSKNAPAKHTKKDSESEKEDNEEEEEEEEKPASKASSLRGKPSKDSDEEDEKPTPKSGTLRSQREEKKEPSKKEQRQREQEEARSDLFSKNLKEKEKEREREKPKSKVETDRDELFGGARASMGAKVPKKIADSDEEEGNSGGFDKEAMQAEIDDLKTDKTRLEKKVERLMKENEDLKAKLADAQSKIKDDDDVGTSSKKKKDDDDSELEDLKRDKTRLERKLEKLQKEYDDFKENSAKQLEEARRNSLTSSSTLKDDKKGKVLSKKEDSKASDYQYKQLQKERDEQAKELEKLTRKLETASAVNEELLETILSGIKVNSTEQNIDDPSVLAFWLSFSGNLFRLLKHEMPSDIRFDKDLLEKEEVEEDLNEMEPVDKFFHELIHVSFDIFGIMVQLFNKQLDNILVPSILEQNNSGKPDVINTDFPTIIQKIMDVLIKTNIPESLIKRILNQIFYFVDAQLFNTLLKRPNLYTCSFGFQIKMLISKVENAITRVNKQHYNSSENLNYAKEAANLLVMDKNIVSDESTRNQIFTHLNVVQIYHIVKNFRPDDFAPDAVPDAVKRSLEDACSRQRGLPLQVNVSDIKRVNLLCAL